ncbi:hypothetical protein [Dyadobacter bucti]|uniref:hypothetical protein n=1 Tax=Dyadobacter bucti TaxID=2572203 RepID=UPI003F714B53
MHPTTLPVRELLFLMPGSSGAMIFLLWFQSVGSRAFLRCKMWNYLFPPSLFSFVLSGFYQPHL